MPGEKVGLSIHRYDRQSIYMDYGRAALGFCVTGAPLLFLEVADALAWPLGLLALLFLWFGARTGIRHGSQVQLTPSGIGLTGPWPGAIAWDELSQVRLAYFAPRRAQAQGWLQLTLRGVGRRRLKLDSTLERFDDVLGRVQRAAAAKDLPLEPVTTANFAALGLDGTQEGERAPDPASRPTLPPGRDFRVR